jgi:hypothetical protein
MARGKRMKIEPIIVASAVFSLALRLVRALLHLS